MASIQQISEQIRQAGASYSQKLPGGRADKYDQSAFDSSALAKGISVEKEHTNDEQVAAEIAMDHLAEDPKYYDKLEKMEQEDGVEKANFARFAAKAKAR
jgi:hypothetical protein